MTTYDKLTIEEFGRRLLSSQDLDPIYVALVGMELEPWQLGRWLLAYWCCYDAGVSSYIADAASPDGFWERMEAMAVNEVASPLGGRWRRAAERRHWRGKNAVASLAALRARYGDEPADMAYYCANGWTRSVPVPRDTPQTCAQVMKRAREHTGFGPWIGFKIADMAERVMGTPISFEEAEVFVFKDPAKAAVMAHRVAFLALPDEPDPPVAEAVRWAVGYLTHEFRDLPAPPGWDRPVALQEVETVLCKWKSHVNGHYPLYNDLVEIRHYTLPWKIHSPLAGRFLDHLPEVPA